MYVDFRDFAERPPTISTPCLAKEQAHTDIFDSTVATQPDPQTENDLNLVSLGTPKLGHQLPRVQVPQPGQGECSCEFIFCASVVSSSTVRVGDQSIPRPPSCTEAQNLLQCCSLEDEILDRVVLHHQDCASASIAIVVRGL